jgi:hypothetical protein
MEANKLASDNVSGNYISIVNPMLEVFEPTKIDKSVIEYQFTEFINKDGSNLDDKEALPQYEIFNNDRDTWMALFDSYIECRFKIKPDANVAANSYFNSGNIALVNGAFNLFKRCEYYIDNKLIESVDQPGYINLINGLLENSLDSEVQLSSELWYPDRNNGLISSSYVEKSCSSPNIILNIFS